jgi:CubicO group peptidase (beta-lactamase class C family)
MSHSAAALSDPAAKDIATGYRYWFFWPVAFDAPYPRSTTPSGFMISSAEDMAHYLVAQLNGGTYGNQQLLSPQGIATLHYARLQDKSLSSYGMGWVDPRTTWINQNMAQRGCQYFPLNRTFPDQHIGIVLTNM